MSLATMDKDAVIECTIRAIKRLERNGTIMASADITDYPMQKFTEAKQVADKWDGRIVMVNDPVEVRDEE